MHRRAFVVGATGTVLICPLAVRGQQANKLFRIGVLNPGPAAPTPQWDAFEQGLRAEGLVEGRDFVFEHRVANGDLARLPAMAADLVRAGVDVILVRGPAPMQAAKAATTKIPIVMAASSADPVGEGLIASFGRPGGNITGITFSPPERYAKQIEILKEALGPITRIAILWDLDIGLYRRNWAPTLERIARDLGLSLQGPFEVRSAPDIERAFAEMTGQRAEGVLTSAGSIAFAYRARIGELSIRHRLPVMSAFREFPLAGNLISFGPSLVALYARAAALVAKILRGATPADLPVEQPSTYHLAVNLKTARALNLSIPPSLLTRADEVIE